MEEKELFEKAGIFLEEARRNKDGLGSAGSAGTGALLGIGAKLRWLQKALKADDKVSVEIRLLDRSTNAAEDPEEAEVV